MRVYVENLGSEPANTTLRIYKDDSLLSQISSENEITPTATGVFISYSGLVVDTSDDFTMKAELALADETLKEREESMETNLKTKEIIFPPSQDDDDTSDNTTMMWMLLIIIIIVIIIVLVAVLLLRKRKREKMAECSECGALIPVDAGTCPKCGAEFSDEIECGECGALMKVTDTSCPVCGAVFTKEGEGEEGEEGEETGEVPKPGVPPAKKPAPPAPTKKTAPPKAAKPAAPAAAAKPGAPAAAPAIPAPPSTATPAAKPAGGEEEEKAECYRCGAIVPLSASMCPECGAEFE
jgi:RNA polymerase subunit RPABC4/transcription elongation factor Spt4